ncbi:MAG: N-carbamoyl-D-amino acid hydrolase [Myxococcota bacterium]|nr:N-carbamoyl-D-amino acid hydrolase [Myxococcota bacterium]
MLKPRLVRLGLVQMPGSADRESNWRVAEAGVRDCAARGAQIICLQELFTTLYFCQTETHAHFDLAEPIPGPTVERFAPLARELEAALVLPFFERRAAGVYHNSAVVLDADGSITGTYRKMHIPDDPGFLEKFYFTPGDLGFRVFDTRYARIAAPICWDQWYPEAARLFALAGAEILFYPTAIGWKPGAPEEADAYAGAWETVQRGHAIANGLYVAAVNRVGREGDLEFWGRSFIAGPFGRIAARAAAYAPENLVAEIDLSLIEQTRREWPFLRDRRIDAFGGLLKRYLDDT